MVPRQALRDGTQLAIAEAHLQGALHDHFRRHACKNLFTTRSRYGLRKQDPGIGCKVLCSHRRLSLQEQQTYNEFTRAMENELTRAMKNELPRAMQT